MVCKGCIDWKDVLLKSRFSPDIAEHGERGA